MIWSLGCAIVSDQIDGFKWISLPSVTVEMLLGGSSTLVSFDEKNHPFCSGFFTSFFFDLGLMAHFMARANLLLITGFRGALQSPITNVCSGMVASTLAMTRKLTLGFYHEHNVLA